MCYEPEILNTHLLSKEELLISYAVVQCLTLLHSFAKERQNPGSVHCRFAQSFDKYLKCVTSLGYWRMKH